MIMIRLVKKPIFHKIRYHSNVSVEHKIYVFLSSKVQFEVLKTEFIKICNWVRFFRFSLIVAMKKYWKIVIFLECCFLYNSEQKLQLCRRYWIEQILTKFQNNSKDLINRISLKMLLEKQCSIHQILIKFSKRSYLHRKPIADRLFWKFTEIITQIPYFLISCLKNITLQIKKNCK